MAELESWQKAELLQRCRLVISDAEFCPRESYNGKDVDFQDSCGCWSEWTQEACSLCATICGTLTGDGYKQRADMERAVRKWADGTLEWDGCDCCGNDLSVSINLFPKKARRKRGGKGVPLKLKHGTTSTAYDKHGCRCGPCCQRKSEQNAKRRKENSNVGMARRSTDGRQRPGTALADVRDAESAPSTEISECP